MEEVSAERLGTGGEALSWAVKEGKTVSAVAVALGRVRFTKHRY